MTDRAERRPRPVLDADERLVGHVAGTDDAGGLLVDLTSEASRELLGARRGVLALEPSEAEAGADAVRLLRNMKDLKRAWNDRDEDP